ncbi:GFA family protein [Parasphingorhabdus sp.]
MDDMIAGGCQCGAIRYSLAGPLPPAYACHCGECKKQSASAFSMSIPLDYDQLQVEGTPISFTTTAFSGRAKHNFFCANCGTRLWHSGSIPPDSITLKVGSLDDSSGIAPQGHLWVSKKQAGIKLDQAIEQFDTQPDDVTEWRGNLGQNS